MGGGKHNRTGSTSTQSILGEHAQLVKAVRVQAAEHMLVLFGADNAEFLLNRTEQDRK